MVFVPKEGYLSPTAEGADNMAVATAHESYLTPMFEKVFPTIVTAPLKLSKSRIYPE